MTGSPAPTKTASSSGELSLRGLWQTHVYDAKGDWMGLFKDETVAGKWADAHGHTDVTRIKPVKGKKP